MVPFPVLVSVGFVPVKPGTILQRIHCCHSFSIRLSYTSGPCPAARLLRSWKPGNFHTCRAVQYSVRPSAFVGMLIVASAQAGVIRPLSIDALAAAPAVVVCRVERVALGPFVPAQKGARPTATRHCTATLRVLRAVPEFPAARIYLSHFCNGPHFAMRNGHPAYPNLEAGRAYVFPLVPHGAQWRLIADEGWGLVVPAIEADPPGARLASKREFIFREITNTLLHGAYADLYRFSSYMQFRYAKELNDEIMAALVAALPPCDPRWLDISAALLATSPRRLSDMAAGGNPHDLFPDAVATLAARTFEEAPEERRREGILRDMLQHSAVHPQASVSVLLPEFKDDPLLLKLLPAYLEQHQDGAVAIACALVAYGKVALEDVTFDAALKVLRDKRAGYADVNGAISLLIHRGSDVQFEGYLAILNDVKVHDRNRYDAMWQPAWEDKSPRILRILAVLLDDPRRTSPWDDVRNCDFAGFLLERFSGEKFGYKPWDKMPLDERNAALKRARAWMKYALNGAH